MTRACCVLAAIVLTVAAGVSAQEKRYAGPRTPWGHPDLQPYECHEGNNALRNMLSAARAEEKVIEEYVRKGLTPPPLARPGDADILPADPSFGRRR